jgi:hypothetical protein
MIITMEHIDDIRDVEVLYEPTDSTGTTWTWYSWPFIMLYANALLGIFLLEVAFARSKRYTHPIPEL